MNNTIHQTFNLLAVIGTDTGINGTDLYNMDIYKSVDNRGDTLKVNIFKYESGAMTISVVYPDIEYVFSTKKEL